MESKPKWEIVFDGRSAKEIVRDLRRDRKFYVGPAAREALAKLRRRPPPKGTKQELVMIRGTDLGPARNRTTKSILGAAIRRGFRGPTPEAALRLRESCPQDELGYPRVVVFHKPLAGKNGEPSFLSLCQRTAGNRTQDSIELMPAYPECIHRVDEAFVFAVQDDGNKRLERELLCPLGKVRRRYSRCGNHYRYA